MIANPKRHVFNDISVSVTFRCCGEKKPPFVKLMDGIGDGEPYEISNNVVRVIVIVHILRTYDDSQGLYIIIVAGHIVLLK